MVAIAIRLCDIGRIGSDGFMSENYISSDSRCGAELFQKMVRTDGDWCKREASE